MPTLPREDLDAIVSDLGEEWTRLRGADVLVTGGTGFFGVWLVSSLLHANDQLGLGLRVHVVARRPEQLLDRLPELRSATHLRLLAADVRCFCPPPATRITHLIHAATAASALLVAQDPAEMAHVAAEGTRNLISLAAERGVERILFTSSGAVYGRNQAEVTHVAEDQMGIVDPLLTRNAYAEGKRLAEAYCAAYVEKWQLPVIIARCYAFVGPFLPLDAHFAIGNFIRDALSGKCIVVAGDGTARRSYLYATDLTSWLLRALLRGTPGRPYNVGSERDVSIAELAALVGGQRGIPFEIRGKRDPSRAIDSYAPSTERIRRELGVAERVSLEEGVRRTMAWYELRLRGGAS